MTTRGFATLLTIVVLGGCQQAPSTDWTSWTFGKVEQLAREDILHIQSKPLGATVVLDGETIGVTPLTELISYTETAAVFKRELVERQGRTEKVIDTERQRRDKTINSTPHEILLRLQGYEDNRFVWSFPADGFNVSPKLTEITGISGIECTLRVTARLRYFQPIEDMIGQHATRDRAGEPMVHANLSSAEPVLAGLDIYRQIYTVVVQGTGNFDRIVTGLSSLAKEYEFVFDVTNVRLSADFDTNDLRGAIGHTVRGRVRPGSCLYLIPRGGRPVRINNVLPDGTYVKPVTLQPGQREIYLLSLYEPSGNRSSPPLAVYLAIDVHKNVATELVHDQFVQATDVRLSQDELRELADCALE